MVSKPLSTNWSAMSFMMTFESAWVRRYLGDAVTHLAGSHYAERFYCHSLSLLT